MQEANDSLRPISTPGRRPAAPPPPKAPEWLRVRARAEASAVKARPLPPPMPHGKRGQLKRSGDSAILLGTLDVVDQIPLEPTAPSELR